MHHRMGQNWTSSTKNTLEMLISEKLSSESSRCLQCLGIFMRTKASRIRLGRRFVSIHGGKVRFWRFNGLQTILDDLLLAVIRSEFQKFVHTLDYFVQAHAFQQMLT